MGMRNLGGCVACKGNVRKPEWAERNVCVPIELQKYSCWCNLKDERIRMKLKSSQSGLS